MLVPEHAPVRVVLSVKSKEPPSDKQVYAPKDFTNSNVCQSNQKAEPEEYFDRPYFPTILVRIVPTNFSPGHRSVPPPRHSLPFSSF
jgi:hypothetical protein